MRMTANSGNTLGDLSCINLSAKMQAIPSKLGVWAPGTIAMYATRRTMRAPRAHHIRDFP